MFDYAGYAQRIREELHMYPELGFDLPKTLAVVRRELEAMGLTHTEQYCRSSVVAYINEDKGPFTVGLRADMDALPIQEEVEVPFKSRIDGQMHACGHDFHTAVQLAVAKYLVDHKEELKCRVKLIFSPAEEYIESGCRHLAENGVMDDVDCAVACHVTSGLPAGKVSMNEEGGINSNSTSFKVEFFGKSSHAASQHNGKDAILMAVDAITAMEFMIAKEVDGRKVKVLNIGSIHGGHTNNVVCDHCEIFGTLRTWDDDVGEYIYNRLQEIAHGVAATCGGKAVFHDVKSLPYVKTDATVMKALKKSAVAVIGEENVEFRNRSMGGEDFAFFTRLKPCGHFHVGTCPSDTTEKISEHNGAFQLDNAAFKVAIDIFTKFVFDIQDGLSF